jgi:very-short-patch-repair endonuclease
LFTLKNLYDTIKEKLRKGERKMKKKKKKGNIDSKGEMAIHQSLKAQNILHVLDYKIEGKRWEYDFYIPQFNLIIELHGKQHYEYIPFYHDKYKGGFEGYKENDIAKRRFAEKIGYKFLEIDYRNHIPKEATKELKKIINKLLSGKKVEFPKYVMPIKEVLLDDIPTKKAKTKKKKIPKIQFESYDDNKMYSRNVGNFY